MRRLGFLVGVGALVLVSYSCAEKPQPAPEELTQSEIEKAAAEGALRAQADLFSANEKLDLEAFLGHLADDFVMAKEGQVMELDAFEKHLAESFSSYDHHVIEWDPIKVSVIAPTAVVITSAQNWVAFDRKGEIMWEGPTAYTAVYELRGGAWKSTHGHLSWASQ
jgi:hypothetical protein